MIYKRVLLVAVLVSFLGALGVAPTQAAPPSQASCSKTYTVVAGDTLASISLGMLGNRDGYNFIAAATNAAHAQDSSYALIPDVNKIEIGWKLCIPDTSDGVQVQTTGGIVESFPLGDVISFKGIPYAAAPVGDLRWRETQPVVPWEGVRRAVAYGRDCPQVLGGVEPIQTTPSEDCLFVNVWRPTDIPEDTKLPVMVWIHGGGWVGGGSSIPFYDGSEFARKGIVVVSLNYRLGRLGFFAHPALTRANEGAVGNFGYMDQIAALNWVQNNIANFGGDPQQVAIVGESAGGGSVLALLTSPKTKGLFQRAMVMSGGGRKGLVIREKTGGTLDNPAADQVDAKFGLQFNIRGDDAASLARLRAIPTADVVGDLDLAKVLEAALECVKRQLLLPNLKCNPELEGTHMIDGDIVTDNPGALFAAGQAANVPLIIGTTALDLPEVFPPVGDPFSYFGADAEAARAAYNAPAELNLAAKLPVLLSMGSDLTMHEPARFAAAQMTAHGNPAWLYRFTYTAESTRPEATGQSHAGELPFMFNMLPAKYGDAVTDKDLAAANAFNTYIANFVKTGNPNGAGLLDWPRFDPAHYDVMDFTLDEGPQFGPDPRASKIQLVEKAIDAQP